MDAKPLITNRLDALDAERFADMLDSPPFRLFAARVEDVLESSRRDCETQMEHQLTRAQGRCAALRTVLALPEIILKEIRKGSG